MLDYASIRQQNIERYGTDITNYGPVLLANLYSEKTHFIFELLQNAQDAGATDITFALFGDRLEVNHNGRPFDERDVESICSIAHSSKKNDLTQIGKFGIGFKAVYAYTRSPRIHSADHNFEIQNFVHPYPCQPRAVADGQTVFVFPFDHSDVPPHQAEAEISFGLARLEPTIVLFLTNLRSVAIEIGGTFFARHQKLVEPTRLGDIATLRKQSPLSEEQENRWWIMSDIGEGFDGRPYTVQIALLLKDDDRVKKVSRSPVFVSFPTEKVFPVGFLLNAPYRTTPARDNIPGDDGWNHFLSTRLGELACRTYRMLRDESRLDLGALDALPTRPDPHPLYTPIYDAILSLMGREPMVPSDQGQYILGQRCWIPRGEEARKLFPSSDLPSLTGTDVAWSVEGLGTDQYSTLTNYLIDNQICRRTPPEHLVELIGKTYLESRSDAWMSEFYQFLNSHRRMHARLRDKPIVRTEDGQHCRCADDTKKPQVFLPGDHPTTFPTLKRVFAYDPVIRSFFQWLGLREPSLLDEVRQSVLPKYLTAQPKVSWDEHLADLKIIKAALEQPTRLVNLKEELKVGNLVALEGKPRRWAPASQAYFRSESLVEYFSHQQEPRFTTPDYDEEGRACLSALGVEDKLRVEKRRPMAQNYVTVQAQHGTHIRGVDGFDPDFWIDSLDLALADPTDGIASYLWNEILVAHASSIEGTLEKSSVVSFSGSKTKRELRVSKAGKFLQSTPWLPGPPDGRFYRPSELSLDDLPVGFVRSEALASKLKMKSTTLGALAKEAGLDPRILEYAIRNQEKLRDLQAKEEKDRRLDAAPKAVSYAQSLLETMNKPPVSGAAANTDEVPIDAGVVKNSALRRERIGEEVAQARADEPDPSARVHRSSRRVYEGKDEATRAALQAWYQGRCQICKDGFAKKNGQPYFEALYLIKTSEAGWVDRPGNALCLCPSCLARIEHGTLEAPDLLEQIRDFKTQSEGGPGSPFLRLRVCGEERQIDYCEKHLLELQVLVAEETAEVVLVEN